MVTSLRGSWRQTVIAAVAIAAAAASVWATLSADFLAWHPGWLAAQKADFILGPAFVGLYGCAYAREPVRAVADHLRVHRGGRHPPLSSNPWLFGAGLHWENVIYLANLLAILTFPPGAWRVSSRS